jgi:DNA-binding beta-propeller fold protein YncE
MQTKFPPGNRLISAICALGFSLTISLSVYAVPPLVEGGKVVIADRSSATISVVSTRSDQLAATIDMPGKGEPMYVFYSPIQRRVFVGDRANNRVVAFDAKTFEIGGFGQAGQGVFHMWGHTGLGQLWVNNDIDNTTSVIDMRSLETIATVPTPGDLVAMGGRPHDVVIGPNGSYAYVSVIGVSGPDDYVVQYDTRTLMEVGRAAVGDDPHVSVTPQTEFLYVPTQGGNAVYVLDRLTMAHVETIAVPGAHGAGMPINGMTFYTTNLPGGGTDAIFAIDTQSLEVVGEPVDSPYPVPHNIALTPDGRKLYLTHSGATSDKVTIYRTNSVTGLPGFVGEVTVGLNPFGLDYVP